MPAPDRYRQIARYSDLIFIPPAAIGLGFLLGWKLDQWLGWHPWGKLACLLLGILVGFYQIFRLVLGGKNDR
jgi:F0F1-type ATP synthase assembly protein I